MSFVEGVGRDQHTLFPEVLDDYIPADHSVRFIDAYVAQLRLGNLGFEEAAQTGRPGYDPGDLLRLYIYGYLNGICSSRKLERESQRNVELMWLLRRLHPQSGGRRCSWRCDSRCRIGQHSCRIQPLGQPYVCTKRGSTLGCDRMTVPSKL